MREKIFIGFFSPTTLAYDNSEVNVNVGSSRVKFQVEVTNLHKEVGMYKTKLEITKRTEQNGYMDGNE